MFMGHKALFMSVVAMEIVIFLFSCVCFYSDCGHVCGTEAAEEERATDYFQRGREGQRGELQR